MFEEELNELEATELAYKKANDFLDDYMKERGGQIYFTELGYIVFAALLRARQHLRTDELAHWLGRIMGSMERSLEKVREAHPDAVLLAEDWRDIEGGEEMLKALAQLSADEDAVVTVPEEWTT